METHIWIQSITVDKEGAIDNHGPLILSPSLETRKLGLKPTDDRTPNDALIRVSFKNKKARGRFYKEPITFDGKTYRMYKRSASSVRQGHVLYIRNDLFEKMDKWSSCGLDLSDEVNARRISENYLAFAAYRALTLSGCENFLRLDPKNILVIEDLESTFHPENIVVVTDKDHGKESNVCVAVGPENHRLFAYENVDDICPNVTNKIWDGQGLLDEGVFLDPGLLENPGDYKNNSMMILRNRFFKSCVFRTKLGKWFKSWNLSGPIERDEKGHPTRINGYTQARRYEDIKMVVTHSSLKYISFFDDPVKGIEQWMGEAENCFGIVKTDKPTAFFDGRYVQTNYQLLNTIFLTKEKVDEFLAQNIGMIIKIASSSKAFLTFLKCTSDQMGDETDIDSSRMLDNPFDDREEYFNPKLSVCRDLVRLNSKFDGTAFYRTYIREYIDQLWQRLSRGRVLVEGTYATIISNPYEMLCYVVKGFNIPKGQRGQSLMQGRLYSPFFTDKEKVLASRSPHILPGNILIEQNEKDHFIDDWFAFNRQIVCIDSIGSPVLHRLNGSDQDGDTLLLTNNKLLVESAEGAMARLYLKFSVPVNQISHAAPERFIKAGKTDWAALAGADDAQCKNRIGEITNLSQIFNSLLWDTYVKSFGADESHLKDLRDLYFMNCMLEVLSNNEIDSAKGKTSFDSSQVSEALRDEANRIKGKKPLFFARIDEKKSEYGVDLDVESKVILGIGDASTKEKMWFSRTGANRSLIIRKNDRYSYDFKKHEPIDLSGITGEVTFLFVCNSNGGKLHRYAILLKDEDLGSIVDDDSVIPFGSIQEALNYESYSNEKQYLVKGRVRACARSLYEAYDTTMDYVFEKARNRDMGGLGGQGRQYVRLQDCYKSSVRPSPKNNCDKEADEFISRLKGANKIWKVLLRCWSSSHPLKDGDKVFLEAAKLNETSTKGDYRRYLESCAEFDYGNFFDSTDRIKTLIKRMDKSRGDDKRRVGFEFYLAMYLMFHSPKQKYKELFEADGSRDRIENQDVDDLLSR